jgi:hypothetical protein
LNSNDVPKGLDHDQKQERDHHQAFTQIPLIINEQSFFLHLQLSPKATVACKAVVRAVNMIKGFWKHGLRILWKPWDHLLSIPPSFKSKLSTEVLAESKLLG